MITEIDKGRFDFYLRHPELIIESLQWEVVAVCNRCKGAVKVPHVAFNNQTVHYTFKPTGCPICGILPKEKAGISYNTSIHGYAPVPHVMWRRRFHILKRTKRLFRAPLIEGFWEYEELGNG